MVGDSVGGPIRWRTHIAAPPHTVYGLLDSDTGRASFWAESASERDGVIEFRFINGYTYESRILERRPPHVWTIEYLGGPVRFELRPDDAGGTD